MSAEAFAKVSEATRLLVEQGFSEQAVTGALEMVGQAVGVCRALIFENRPGATAAQRAAQVKYAWTAAPLDGLARQSLPLEEKASGWVEGLSRGQVTWQLVKDVPAPMKGVLEAQQAQSVLLCPLMVGGQWWGFLRADDCQKERRWTAQEVSVVKMLTGALSMALRADQRRAEHLVARTRLEGVVQRFAAVP